MGPRRVVECMEHHPASCDGRRERENARGNDNHDGGRAGSPCTASGTSRTHQDSRTRPTFRAMPGHATMEYRRAQRIPCSLEGHRMGGRAGRQATQAEAWERCERRGTGGGSTTYSDKEHKDRSGLVHTSSGLSPACAISCLSRRAEARNARNVPGGVRVHFLASAKHGQQGEALDWRCRVPTGARKETSSTRVAESRERWMVSEGVHSEHGRRGWKNRSRHHDLRPHPDACFGGHRDGLEMRHGEYDVWCMS